MSQISDYPLYVSAEQKLRDDAHTYAQRAQVYITQNKFDHAIGCLNKAIRKINRANLLKMSPLDAAIFGPLMNELSAKIAEKLLKG